MAKIMDGKALAAKIREELKKEIQNFSAKSRPCLATVLVGDDPASAVYVRHKISACKETGVDTIDRHLPNTISQDELLRLLRELADNPKVSGILIQLPLPKQINPSQILEAMPPSKDADGFGISNWGRLFQAKDPSQIENYFIPCTPLGILRMLKAYHIDIGGRLACVLGRSNIVGRPMAHLLTLHDATVITAHSKTRNLPEITRQADILVAAIGRPKFVTREMVKEGSCVIDVGINRLENGKLSGDCDFEGVSQKAGLITPVPGGVGPMTIAMLLSNTVKAWKLSTGL